MTTRKGTRTTNGRATLYMLKQFTATQLSSFAPDDRNAASRVVRSLSDFIKQVDSDTIGSKWKVSRRSGLQKLSLLLKRLPEFLAERDTCSELCEFILNVVELCFESFEEEIDDVIFGMLVAATAPIILDIVAGMRVDLDYLIRLAELLSTLVEYICHRARSRSGMMVNWFQFLLLDAKLCTSLGSCIGECGSFLLQANIIEAVVKAIRGLLHGDRRSDVKKVGSRICQGISSGDNVDFTFSGNLMNSLLCIAESDDQPEDTFAKRIRSWINMVNEGRFKFNRCTVFSYCAPKMLLNDKDMQVSVWVDLNKINITITGANVNLGNDIIGPLAVSIAYENVVEAQGRQSASAIILHLTRYKNLLEGTIEEKTKIVLEFTRSDFPSVVYNLQRSGIRFSKLKCHPILGAQKNGKLPTGHIAAHRKASISFSTGLLEQFLGTDPFAMKGDVSQKNETQANPSGGMPIRNEKRKQPIACRRCDGFLDAAQAAVSSARKRISTEWNDNAKSLKDTLLAMETRHQAARQQLLTKYCDQFDVGVSNAMTRLYDQLIKIDTPPSSSREIAKSTSKR